MKKYTIQDLITTIADNLLPVYDSPTLREQYAWWTLESIANTSKTKLLLQPDIILTDEQYKKIGDWVDRMVTKHEPIQYLIGSVPFNNVEIFVEPPILIPRPETEEWTANLIDQLKKLGNKSLRILDVCCGSGCIAIALAKSLPTATVVALDIDPQAIALTKKNAQRNHVIINCYQSDLFDAVSMEEKFDLIVSNPPYISQDEWDDLDPSVSRWEAHHALIAADHGLQIIKKIIAQARSYLNANQALAENNIPHVMLEIGYKQGAAVAQLMRDAGFANVVVHKDLEGKDRVVSGNIIHHK